MAMANTPLTTLRLTPEDLAILDAVVRRSGAPSRTEAVRIALRHYQTTTTPTKAKATTKRPLKR